MVPIGARNVTPRVVGMLSILAGGVMVSGIWHYRGAARFGALAVILALAGCSSVNPVHWYKHVVRHKPDATDAAPVPQPVPDASAEEPYPSLATVPPPSTFGLTDAQRAGLAEGLVADRQHAKYVEQEAEAADAVPMPPAPAVSAPPPPAIPDTAASDAVSAPDAIVPPPSPVRKVRTKKKPTASAVENSLAASGLSSGGPFDQSTSSPSPRESPEPDAAAPAPDAPSLPPVPVAPPTPAAAPAAAQAVDAAVPEAPALAVVPSTKPAIVAKSVADAVPVVVTAIHFASGSTSLPADSAGSLAKVAGVLAKSGGRVHVVSHAASGGDATASLAAYQAALARAKAVRLGLVATGIPESSIATEVSSSITNEANDTAEVLVGK